MQRMRSGRLQRAAMKQQELRILKTGAAVSSYAVDDKQ
jgi:hypothetical protein